MSKKDKHRNKNGPRPSLLPNWSPSAPFGTGTSHDGGSSHVNLTPVDLSAVQPAAKSSLAPPAANSSHPSIEETPPAAKTVEQAENKILELSEQELVKKSPMAELPSPAPLTQDEIVLYCNEAYRAKLAYENALEAFKRKNDPVASAEPQTAKATLAAGPEKPAAIDNKNRDVDAAIADVRQRERNVAAKEGTIEKREIEVASGLIAQKQAHVQSLDTLIESTKVDLAKLTEELATVRSRVQREEQEHRSRIETISREALETYRQELDRQHVQIQQRLTDDRTSLENESKEIRALQANLAKREKDIELREELYQEDLKTLQRKLDRLVAAEREKHSLQLAEAKDALKQAREDRDRLRAELDKREVLDRRFEQRSPDQVLAEITRLKNENVRLNTQLGSAASQNEMEQLEGLKKEQVRWQEERRQLRYQLNDLKKQVEDKGIAVAELETLRRIKESRQSLNEMLQTEIDRLRGELDTRIKKHHGKNPFPACASIDDDQHHQTPPPQLQLTIPNLKMFAVDLRQRLAHPKQGRPLYYAERDVRAFLGGLAMSRLHILQGISGTGKTSLPIAAAEAMGAGFQLVEVQAGWREIHDLIGHFNSFENTFYESKFLKALYEAQCPAFRDRLFFVILDEMNLSRVVQYVSDLLSLLEQPVSQKRWLTLLSSPKPVAPRLIENGERLALPDNVWFVGTANHDETTLEFADKTYDRAAVLELPWTKVPFKVTSPPTERAPIGMDGLRRAFAAAARTHGPRSMEIWKDLGRRIEPIFNQSFGVGWGNRLDRQVEDFVPVIVAAGGTHAEAFDQLVCTKLLRKVRHRHDTSEADLRRLHDELSSAWKLCGDGLPDRCQQVLHAEIKRVSSDGESTGG